MKTRAAHVGDRGDWLRMRECLWQGLNEDHRGEIDSYLAGTSAVIEQAFVCEDEAGAVVGFVELRIRNFAEGTDRIAVPYIEAWYVDAGCRGRGVGASLIAQAEAWAKANGYRELASDTWLDNEASQAAHEALGFEEVERIVCYLKKL